MDWVEYKAMIQFLSQEGENMTNLYKRQSNVYGKSVACMRTLHLGYVSSEEEGGELKTKTILLVKLRRVITKMSRKSTRWCLKIDKSP